MKELFKEILDFTNDFSTKYQSNKLSVNEQLNLFLLFQNGMFDLIDKGNAITVDQIVQESQSFNVEKLDNKKQNNKNK